MKTRFSGLDLTCEVRELQPLVGMRLNRIYDADKKTYLLKLQRTEEKAVVLVESGSRIHATNSIWPKNDAPSGFTMKLRKHLRNKRLERVFQMGVDRVVVLQFGSGEVANYLVVELYDRGNIILTDHEHVILGVLRPRVADENNKVFVKETYPIITEEIPRKAPTADDVRNILNKAGPNDNLKKMLVPHCAEGPALLEHILLANGLTGGKKKKDLGLDDDELAGKLAKVLSECAEFLGTNEPRGFITQKVDGDLTTNVEFHPFSFGQHAKCDSVKAFGTFNIAVDEFFSSLETQKIDMKVVQQEKQAMKKLENIKKDHEQRLQKLESDQLADMRGGELVELNSDLVERALDFLRNAIANQIDWKDIEEIVEEAADVGDPVLSRIVRLRLDINHFIMRLSDPYCDDEQDLDVDLDIDLSAQANARKFYDKKKSAALKEQKTLQSHSVAMKSAEKKTKQALREVAVSANITKARKTYWFEKFFWFISSENYLVIGGRDQQQNELIVKRYMASTDVYVHADLHGASSVIVKNPKGGPVPPKTLNEAGQMAICYSAAWDSKVVTSAWYVESSQVSKSAPTGEYLSTGSFMIRGKKNYLPPSYLILGFGILFKVGDDCVERHKNERRVRLADIEEECDNMKIEETTDDIKGIEVKESESGENSSQEEEDEDEKTEKGQNSVEKVEQGKSGENLAKDFGQEEPSEGVKSEESGGERVDEESEQLFPDTQLQMNFSKGGGIEFVAEGRQEVQPSFVGPRTGKKKGEKVVENLVKSHEEGGRGQVRGKRGKMKKIREKYKDQDEEEKALRMQLLHQAQRDDNKRAKKKQKELKAKAEKESKAKAQADRKSRPTTNFRQTSTMADDEPTDETTFIRVSDEVDMIDALTGIPHAEDELLFAMPVIGPYNSMTSFKYKVKMTPGTAKRGKAAKTTLAVFLAEKSASTREKDLLKSLKDQDVSRNMPGKVKISAPQLQKTKAKKS